VSKKLEEKFLQFDLDRDGVLNKEELYKFFDSFRQTLTSWELEMMIMQYDILRDNGLRFDALKIWYERRPVHGDTRNAVLHAAPHQLVEYAPPPMSDKEREYMTPGVNGGVRVSTNSLVLSAMGATVR